MSDLGYLIWFIATAAVIVAVLAIGTLAAAGLLTREGRRRDRQIPHAGPGRTAAAGEPAGSGARPAVSPARDRAA